MDKTATCELCATPGGEILCQVGSFRVVLVDDPLYPGFCRVIASAHVKEMTDLPVADRHACMQLVFAVEAAMRDVLQPEKINVASLGNMTPHVHWHVIPRYQDDAHFPAPVWAAQQRDVAAQVLEARRGRLPALREAILREITRLG